MDDVISTGLLASLLDLDRYGMRVVSVLSEETRAEVWVKVETTATVVGCEGCGVRARAKDRRSVTVRDLEVSGRPLVVVWHKRVWQCPEPSCATKTWTERSGFALPRQVLSERAQRDLLRCVGEENDSVAAQARRFAVSWHTAMAAVSRLGTPLVDDPARLDGVKALGMDETKYLAANMRRLRRTEFATAFADLDATTVLDIVLGREGAAVARWLDERPQEWLDRIEVCAMDPHRGYFNAVTARLACPVVMDPFHTIGLANRRVDQARRRVQRETHGRRGRNTDPLYRARKLLLMGDEHHTEQSWARLKGLLDQGDLAGEVGAVWVAKELLRAVYKADSRRQGHERLFRFYMWCADNGDIAELISLAHVIEQWQTQILNYFDDRYSNARTEGLNWAIKNVKRVGRGFTNFTNYRLRVLLHTGIDWNTQRPARLRTRRPRIAA